MSRVFEFIKTTAIGGLLVIVPIAIIVFVVGQLLFGLADLAEELVKWFGIRKRLERTSSNPMTG